MGISEKKTKKANLFISGVVILSIANIVIKIIGLMFKIPLTHIIGDSGMGYFNSAYTIYVWFYMISTAGLPVAVSILISEARAKGNIKEVNRIYKVTMIIFIIVGAIGTTAMMTGSYGFASLIGNDGARNAIFAIAPTLFFICISSAIRGYFQGYQHMAPTAVSQLIEAIGKLIFGILFSLYAISKGYPLTVVAAFALLGIVTAVFLGMAYLLVVKWFFKPRKFDEIYMPDSAKLHDVEMPVRSSGTIAKIIAKTAIPVTISSSVMSLTNLIDLSIVMRRLQSIGLSQAMSNAIWGNYSSLAVPMFNLPPVLIYPISYSLIPLLSANIAKGNREEAEKEMHSTIRIASIIIIPMAIGMSAIAGPILKLLYNADSANMAAPLLSILALSVIFVGLISVTNAILQATKNERLPIVSMIIGGIVKIVASIILIGIPQIGIYGTPIGTLLCYFTTTVINFIFLKKHVGISPRFSKTFLKPLLAGVLCGIAAFGSYYLISLFLDMNGRLNNAIGTVVAILFAVLVYFIVIIVMKGIHKDDLEMVPYGAKIFKLLNKIGVMQ